MAFRRMLLYVAWVVVMLSKMAAAPAVPASFAQPDCQHRCGDHVEIPYPFGTTKNCCLHDDYLINCSNSKPLLWDSNIDVTNISIQGELEILMFKAHQCLQDSSDELKLRNRPSLKTGTFTISNTKNKFFAIGCDTYGYLTENWNNEPFTIGCMSICQSLENVVDRSCTGIGCCKVDIPTGLKNLTLEANSYYNHKNVSEFNPCSFAFVAKQEYEFKFSSDDLKKELVDIDAEQLNMVLDWAIGDEKCKIAQNKPDYVCRGNNSCENPPNGIDGYRCKCKEGYYGNPYLPLLKPP